MKQTRDDRYTDKQQSQVTPGHPQGIVAGEGRFVLGCPCFMDFGVEKVCINGDDVRPVSYVRVQKGTPLDLDIYRKGKDTSAESGTIVCCAMVDIGRSDGTAYCALRDEPLVINGRRIRSSDIRDAVSFILFTGDEDAEACSSCIYKYLVTIGGFIDEEMAEDEAKDAIENYLRLLARDREGKRWATYDTEEFYMGVLRSHMRGIIEERRAWSRAIEVSEGDKLSEGIVGLLGLYRQVSRMEIALHSQLLSFWDRTSDSPVSPSTIRSTTRKIVGLCDKIHQESGKLLDEDIPDEIRTVIREHQEKRRSLEKRVEALLDALDSTRRDSDGYAHRIND